jgi:dTDP-4-dehydrorhamnose 3,5-epimerase
MLDVRPLGIPGLLEIRPPVHRDDRGFFSEVWSRESMRSIGVSIEFVQDNHSFSADRGVLRGLHFQTPPAAQDKLIRVTHGAIFDVAVDIRRGSPTLGKWVSLVVSAASWNQMLVPRGFAHGFVTLEPNTEVHYKVSAPYSPEHERGIRYDDPAFAIEWPVSARELILSTRDTSAPAFAHAETGFVYR